MAKSGYTVTTEGEVTLAAAGTSKTVLSIQGNSNAGIDLHGFWIDFDGVSASDKPVKVTIGSLSFAGAGTAGATPTVRQLYGRLTTTGLTGKSNYSAEPTTIVSLDEFALDVNKGLFRYDWPLGETPDSPLNEGFCIRTLIESADTAAGAIRAGLRFERC